MNLSPQWVDFLANSQIEAVHWQTVGAFDALDEIIMAYAVATNAVILTSDLDFGAILAASGERSPSVVQIRAEDLSISAIGPAILAALLQVADLLTSGALVTVEPARTRLTVLPIRDSE